jgi:hypothetical protein
VSRPWLAQILQGAWLDEAALHDQELAENSDKRALSGLPNVLASQIQILDHHESPEETTRAAAMAIEESGTGASIMQRMETEEPILGQASYSALPEQTSELLARPLPNLLRGQP